MAVLPDNSRTQRWIKYGSSVLALLLAVLVIVVLINWIAVRRVRQLGPWTRIDMTATRQYSLSPQTRRIVNDLEAPVRIVTVFAGGLDMPDSWRLRIRRFRELLDEYELRSGGKVKVEHVRPGLDVDSFERLADDLRARYADELAPYAEAFAAALEAFDAISAVGAEQAPLYKNAQALLARSDPAMGEQLEQISTYFEVIDERMDLALLRERIGEIGESPLPHYEATANLVAAPLRQIRTGLLEPVSEGFRAQAKAEGVDPDAREFYANAGRAASQLLTKVSAAIGKLEAAEAEEYTRVRRTIADEQDAAVVMTDERVTVLQLDDVYTARMSSEDGEAAPEQRFRGEEAVTGAIISLTLETKPKVVFVVTGPQPALGQGGLFDHVAGRLENMSFEVEEWNPSGRQTQFGPMPPGPKPTAEPGQPLVWVYWPAPTPNPQSMMAGGAQQMIAQTLAETIESGDPVLVFVPASPMARFGQADPIAQTLARYGVEARSSQAVVSAVQDPRGEPMATTQISLGRWPTEHPIGQAVDGLAGLLLGAVPVDLADAETDAVKGWPLIRTGPGTWAETEMGREAKQDDDEQAGPITVGVAVESTDGGEGTARRLVVIGDMAFAIDEITQYGPTDFLTGQVVQVFFPANAELFVNSVYWLSGLDDLIATSARTQDVRRFDAISETARLTVGWILLAGLPLGCLFVGGLVWTFRRK